MMCNCIFRIICELYGMYPGGNPVLPNLQESDPISSYFLKLNKLPLTKLAHYLSYLIEFFMIMWSISAVLPDESALPRKSILKKPKTCPNPQRHNPKPSQIAIHACAVIQYDLEDVLWKKGRLSDSCMQLFQT